LAADYIESFTIKKTATTFAVIQPKTESSGNPIGVINWPIMGTIDWLIMGTIDWPTMGTIAID
jgi:hypothetical protein